MWEDHKDKEIYGFAVMNTMLMVEINNGVEIG